MERWWSGNVSSAEFFSDLFSLAAKKDALVSNYLSFSSMVASQFHSKNLMIEKSVG